MKANLYVAIFNFIVCLTCTIGGNLGWAFANLILGFINLSFYNGRY